MAAEHRHHDEDAPRTIDRSPANRLGLDYRDVPPRKLRTRIVDVHSHVRPTPTTAQFFEAADLYEIDKIVTMTPLEEVDELLADHARRLELIAVPAWRSIERSADFRKQWISDLGAFRERGARRMKFWMAPPLRGNFGLTLEDAFFAPVIEAALELDYDFMVHIADPSAWFEPGGRYADTTRFGTKRDQYPQLEWFLDQVAPRSVIAAHMGGSVEDPDLLQGLLDRHDNLLLDSSATKWVVRGVAARPEKLRDFMIRNQDRVLFGSDLVVGPGYDFDHYASRYWAHRMMWETDYRGESPIADPDADDPPRLAGLDLPADVLEKLMHVNAEKLGY